MQPQPKPMLSVSGTFLFPSADPIYADHFPDAPTVPGTVIIHAFMQKIQTVLGETATGERVTVHGFRFRQFVTPGMRAFSIEEAPNSSVAPHTSPNQTHPDHTCAGHMGQDQTQLDQSVFTCRLYAGELPEGRPAATGKIICPRM